MGIMNGNGTWEQVLQYIYKYKRARFNLENYQNVEEQPDKHPSEVGSKVEEVKMPETIFENEQMMNLQTMRNDDDSIHLKDDEPSPKGHKRSLSSKIEPETIAPNKEEIPAAYKGSRMAFFVEILITDIAFAIYRTIIT